MLYATHICSNLHANPVFIQLWNKYDLWHEYNLRELRAFPSDVGDPMTMNVAFYQTFSFFVLTYITDLNC